MPSRIQRGFAALSTESFSKSAGAAPAATMQRTKDLVESHCRHTAYAYAAKTAAALAPVRSFLGDGNFAACREMVPHEREETGQRPTPEEIRAVGWLNFQHGRLADIVISCGSFFGAAAMTVAAGALVGVYTFARNPDPDRHLGSAVVNGWVSTYLWSENVVSMALEFVRLEFLAGCAVTGTLGLALHSAACGGAMLVGSAVGAMRGLYLAYQGRSGDEAARSIDSETTPLINTEAVA